MSCDRFRAWLVDDDLPSAERAALDEHLAQCVECRKREGEFRAARQWLDDLPDPDVQIDPRAVLAGSLERAERSRRRWRRGALLATAAALLLALGLALRVEVVWGPDQVAIAWRAAKPAVAPTVPTAQPPASFDHELERLNEIAALLAAELDDQDFRHRRDLALLVGQLRQLQSAQQTDYALLERDFRALYAATQTSITPTGGRP